MRIISGKYKSRRFQLPSNFTARPTTDFAKESLFNILNNIIEWEETTVLDLFSGSGSMAIEFVSRGCPHVVSVESNNKNHAFISKVKEILQTDELLNIKADAFQFIKSYNQAFDLIFADPPYNLNKLEQLPHIILNKDVLKDGGLFILEHSKTNSFADNPFLIDQRKYGNVFFSFFKK